MKRMTATLVSVMLGTGPAIAIADSDMDRNKDQQQQQQQSEEVDTFVMSTAKGRLGAVVMGLTPELREYFGAPRTAGLLVAHVEPGSPAARAGLRVGDVLTSVGGKRVDNASDVLMALSNNQTSQQRIPLDVVRNGQHMRLQASLPRSQNTQQQNEDNPSI